jgi:hypothetical protein
VDAWLTVVDEGRRKWLSGRFLARFAWKEHARCAGVPARSCQSESKYHEVLDLWEAGDVFWRCPCLATSPSMAQEADFEVENGEISNAVSRAQTGTNRFLECF